VATHVPLTALPAFEATVRLGAMSAAAEELGRTPGAISKQIAQLEAALGARLFERAGRGLRPTPEGAAYARAVAEALEGLRRAGERIGESGRGRVVLRLSGALAARWLIPRLPAFQAERPDAAVELSVTAGGARFGAEPGEWDALLSWDALTRPRSALRAMGGAEAALRPLGDARYGPVRAPGGAACGDGVLRGDVVVHAELPELWDRWVALSGARVEGGGRRSFPNTSLCIEAALAGMGAAVVERRLVADDLAAARLEAPLGFATVPGGFAAVVRRRGRAVDALLDWLAAVA